MPRTSAFITTAGGLLLLIGGAVVSFRSGHQTTQQELQRHLHSAHNVGYILYDKIRFPRFLLRVELQHSSETSIDRKEDLRAYTVTGLILRHKDDAKEWTIEIGSTKIGEATV